MGHAAQRVLLASVALGGCAQSAFCDSTGVGNSARAAFRAYLDECGTDYKIARGPYDGYKQATLYARYAHLVELALDVRGNSEGTTAFLLVGERTPNGPWRTLGRPGTGP